MHVHMRHAPKQILHNIHLTDGVYMTLHTICTNCSHRVCVCVLCDAAVARAACRSMCVVRWLCCAVLWPAVASDSGCALCALLCCCAVCARAQAIAQKSYTTKWPQLMRPVCTYVCTCARARARCRAYSLLLSSSSTCRVARAHRSRCARTSGAYLSRPVCMFCGEWVF